MTTTPGLPHHRVVVATALEDWWTLADPAAPFDSDDAALLIDLYLHSSGYTIAPDLPRSPRVPTRRAIATVIVLAGVCAASVALSAWRGDWWWASLGALGTVLLVREAARDITDRRHHRPAR